MARSKRQRYGVLVFPLVRACTVTAVLAALSSVVDRSLPPIVTTAGRADTRSGAQLLRPCPAGTLLDGNVCVPVPESLDGVSEPARGSSWQVYDSIPRRPERPSQHSLYGYPVEAEQVQPSPFEDPAAMHAALLLGAKMGSPVLAVDLEGQVAASAVLFAGELVGKSVVTEHRIEETGREQIYLVLYGNLESIDARAGSQLKAGERLGSVGNSATGHAVGLHLEVRRVRHGIDPRQLHSQDYLSRASTIACDPRNVFRLRPAR